MAEVRTDAEIVQDCTRRSQKSGVGRGSLYSNPAMHGPRVRLQSCSVPRSYRFVMTMSPLNVRMVSVALPSPKVARMSCALLPRGRGPAGCDPSRVSADRQRQVRPDRTAEAVRVQLEAGGVGERQAHVAGMRIDVVAAVARHRARVLDVAADRLDGQPFAGDIGERHVAADRAQIEPARLQALSRVMLPLTLPAVRSPSAAAPVSETSPDTHLACSRFGVSRRRDVAADGLGADGAAARPVTLSVPETECTSSGRRRRHGDREIDRRGIAAPPAIRPVPVVLGAHVDAPRALLDDDLRRWPARC